MTDAASDRAIPFRRDGARLSASCTSFVRSTVDAASTDGVAVILDGRLETSAVATLAVDALGQDAVYGLVLPSSKLGSMNAQDAEAVAATLGIETDTIHLQPLLTCFGDMAPDHTDLHGDLIVRRNLVARLRMVMAYLAANAMGRLVVGSATRTELLLGSATKYGDGAADLFPVGGLYVTELEALAEDLALPAFVSDPTPAAHAYPDRSGQYGIEASVETIDAVLYRYVEDDWAPERIRVELGVDQAIVDRILRHHRATDHKRRCPPVGPRVSASPADD